jgi:hypothetical protein
MLLGGRLASTLRAPWGRWRLQREESASQGDSARAHALQSAEGLEPRSDCSQAELLFPTDGRVPNGFGLAPELIRYDAERVELDAAWWRIISRHSAPNLAQALPLQPQAWRPGELLLRVDDAVALSQAMVEALSLGSTELRVAQLGRWSWLQVSAASLFLVETWEGRGHPCYSKVGESVWVRAAWSHPWQALLERMPEFRRPGAWTLVDHEQWLELDSSAFVDAWPQVELRDAPELLRFDPKAEPLRLQISLRWARRSEAAMPELWLLEAAQQPRLEALLGRLAEADLRNLQLALLQGAGGKPFFVLRERIVGRSRQHLELGMPYASVAGAPRLFLPVERSFDPPLSGGRLCRLLGIELGCLNLVRPEGEGFRLLSFSEAAFAPLTSLIDYLVEVARERVEELILRSPISLGEAIKLPSRAGMQPQKSRTSKRPRKTLQTLSSPPLPQPQLEATPQPSLAGNETAAAQEQSESGETQEPSTGSEQLELESASSEQSSPPSVVLAFEEESASMGRSSVERAQRIAELQSAIVATPADAQLWMQLAHAELDDVQALACAEQALWLGEAGLRAAFEAFVAACPAPNAALWRRILALPALAHEDKALSQAYHDTLSALRRAEPTLSKRARWMSWRELSRVVPDELEAARVREALLRELSLFGMQERDSFSFLRMNLRREHLGTALATEYAELFERLYQEARQIATLELGLEALAGVREALDAMGVVELDFQEAWARVQELRPASGARACAAWGAAASRCGNAEGMRFFRAAMVHVEQMESNYQRTLATRELFFQVRSASLGGTSRELGLELLSMLSRQRVAGRRSGESDANLLVQRECLDLGDAAVVLVELGVGAELAVRARALLSDAFDADQAYYVRHALQALRTVEGNEQQLPEAAQLLSTLMLRAKYDVSTLATLDYCLECVGTAELEAFRIHVVSQEEEQRRLLETVLVRAQLLRGEGAELEQWLRVRLRESWSSAQPRLAVVELCRLLSLLAGLGRPSVALSILDEQFLLLSTGQAADWSLNDRALVLTALTEALVACGLEQSLSRFSKVLDLFELWGSSARNRGSFLFQAMNALFEHLPLLPSRSEALALSERAASIMQQAMGRATDNPYYLFLARLKRAVSLLLLGESEGVSSLSALLAELRRVRSLDGRDRVDLCTQGIMALGASALDGKTCAPVYEALLDNALDSSSGGRRGGASDTLRRDIVCAVVKELLMRDSALQLAIRRTRSAEEQEIRQRVVQHGRFQASVP